jgi:hypothetical protein
MIGMASPSSDTASTNQPEPLPSARPRPDVVCLLPQSPAWRAQLGTVARPFVLTALFMFLLLQTDIVQDVLAPRGILVQMAIALLLGSLAGLISYTRRHGDARFVARLQAETIRRWPATADDPRSAIHRLTSPWSWRRQYQTLATEVSKFDHGGPRPVVFAMPGSVPPKVPDAPLEPIMLQDVDQNPVWMLLLFGVVMVCIATFEAQLSAAFIASLALGVVLVAAVKIWRQHVAATHWRISPGRVERIRFGLFDRNTCDVWPVEPGVLFVLTGVEIDPPDEHDNVGRLVAVGPAGVETVAFRGTETRRPHLAGAIVYGACTTAAKRRTPRLSHADGHQLAVSRLRFAPKPRETPQLQHFVTASLRHSVTFSTNPNQKPPIPATHPARRNAAILLSNQHTGGSPCSHADADACTSRPTSSSCRPSPSTPPPGPWRPRWA